jgi:hypothetical protein
VNYKDQESLRAESEEGHRLGFDGKVRPPRTHTHLFEGRVNEIASYSS